MEHLCMYPPVKKTALYRHFWGSPYAPVQIHSRPTSGSNTYCILCFLFLGLTIGLPHECLFCVLDLCVKELLLYFPAACFSPSLSRSRELSQLAQGSGSLGLHCLRCSCGRPYSAVWLLIHSHVWKMHILSVFLGVCTCTGASLGRPWGRVSGDGFPALVAKAKLSFQKWL